MTHPRRPADEILLTAQSSHRPGILSTGATFHSESQDDILDEPLCTTRVRQQLSTVYNRKRARDADKHHDPWAREDAEVSPTLAKLRSWWRYKDRGLFGLFKARKYTRPVDEELEKLAMNYFPLRGDLRVRVVDFGDGFSRVHEALTLKDFKDIVRGKPSDVDVRWIHVPLGRGLAASSAEDIFLAFKETPADVGPSHSWPYLEMETLTLISRDEYCAMRDIYSTLSQSISENKSLHERLDKVVSNTGSSAWEKDIAWRAAHHGERTDYWNLVGSDIPYQIKPSIAENDIAGRPVYNQHATQTPWNLPLYMHSQLVRNKLRCFHRVDGLLLTTSLTGGVDYIDRDLNTYLKYSKQKREESEDASVLGYLLQRFARTGTRTWAEPTVEWLLTYILTEYAVTPHNIRGGWDQQSLINAYQSAIERLNLRRNEEIKRHESVRLVKDYLACGDEMNSIRTMLKTKLALLTQLQEAIERDDKEKALPAEPLRDRELRSCDSALDRVLWAKSLVEERGAQFEGLLEDLRLATQAMFQLRTIEQNELAVAADIQNKAVLAFTGVTVIFLPLSFFTSYYGMNLTDVRETQRDSKWFWGVCGSVGFVIIFLSIAYAFRHRLRFKALQRRKTEELMV